MPTDGHISFLILMLGNLLSGTSTSFDLEAPLNKEGFLMNRYHIH